MLEFLEIPAEYELLVNLVFLACTGFIAWNGIRYRDENGDTDFVRLLFSCIAGLFFFAVLAQDVLGLVKF